MTNSLSPFSNQRSQLQTGCRLYPDVAGLDKPNSAPPILLFHGSADKTVSFSQAESLVEALVAAGADDVTLMRYEGAAHNVFRDHAPEIKPAMEHFFARTLHSAHLTR